MERYFYTFVLKKSCDGGEFEKCNEVFKKADVMISCDRSFVRAAYTACSLLTVWREMEANSSAFKNSLSLAVGPIQFREESPKRKTSFMVDDLVRDPNILMSAPYSDRSLSLAEPSFRDRVQQAIGGATKPGICCVHYNRSIFNVSLSKYTN